MFAFRVAIVGLFFATAANADAITVQANPPPGPLLSSGLVRVSSPASIGAPHECKGHYPPDAVLAMRGGRTLVAFVIVPNGTVIDPKVVTSSRSSDSTPGCCRPERRSASRMATTRWTS